jgi:hypothetical protein
MRPCCKPPDCIHALQPRPQQPAHAHTQTLHDFHRPLPQLHPEKQANLTPPTVPLCLCSQRTPHRSQGSHPAPRLPAITTPGSEPGARRCRWAAGAQSAAPCARSCCWATLMRSGRPGARSRLCQASASRHGAGQRYRGAAAWHVHCPAPTPVGRRVPLRIMRSALHTPHARHRL